MNRRNNNLLSCLLVLIWDDLHSSDAASAFQLSKLPSQFSYQVFDYRLGSSTCLSTCLCRVMTRDSPQSSIHHRVSAGSAKTWNVYSRRLESVLFSQDAILKFRMPWPGKYGGTRLFDARAGCNHMICTEKRALLLMISALLTRLLVASLKEARVFTILV